MIHDASRRRVQPATSATIAGSATAVTMSSRPARNTPPPMTASRRRASRRAMGCSGPGVTRPSVGRLRDGIRGRVVGLPQIGIRVRRLGFPGAGRALGSRHGCAQGTRIARRAVFGRERLVRHDLLPDRLIGPFLTQRRRKGRDRRVLPSPGRCTAASRRVARAVEGDGDADAASHVRPGGEAPARGQGGAGAGPRGPRAARRAARLPERAVRGPPQVPAGRDRGHPRPRRRRSTATRSPSVARARRRSRSSGRPTSASRRSSRRCPRSRSGPATTRSRRSGRCPR